MTHVSAAAERHAKRAAEEIEQAGLFATLEVDGVQLLNYGLVNAASIIQKHIDAALLPLTAKLAAAERREWRAFLMSAGDSLWLTFGPDAVEAAKALPVAEEAVSVSGTFDCRTPIDLRRTLWPYFTAWPRVTRSLPLPSPPAREGE